MQRFPRQAAICIAAASLGIALQVATIAWFWAREQAEEEVVALAKEEAQQFLRHFGASDLSREGDEACVADAAKVIVGGIFDIVEIYDPTGRKPAEATTEAGRQVEALLPKQQRPTYSQAHYESKTLLDDRSVGLGDRQARFGHWDTQLSRCVDRRPHRRRDGVEGSAMQSLIADSFLHDVGKIGIPDAILLKPADEIRARLVDGSKTTARALLKACIRRYFAIST